MKQNPRKLFFILLLTLPFFAIAQDKLSIKYGRLNVADFTLPEEDYLKDADAVYLADIGSTEFEGGNKGWFTLVFKRHVRIKINNTNGFDAATFQIPVYSYNGSVEKLAQLKGTTYNLENGKIVETVLKDDQVFVDKKDKRFWIKKFTMPAVKVGSVIDVVYTVESDFMTNLREWEFQGEYPRIWSEYEVMIPEMLEYVTMAQGYRKFDINKRTQSKKNYSISTTSVEVIGDRYNFESIINDQRWVMKKVPALKTEPFTSTINNHISKIEFQLSKIKYPSGKEEDRMNNWVGMTKKLNENEYFGADLYKNNKWLDDDVKSIVGSTTEPLEKAHKIYAAIRDGYTCIDSRAVYLTDAGLKNIVKNKKGSVADLNLLLVAMLQHEGITAYPLILGTRAHGYTSEIYPLMDRFNMTVAVAAIDDQVYYLDASDPLLGFGKLNSFCYNGHARVINGSGVPVYLDADSLLEKKVTSMLLVNNENKWEGSLNSTLGYVESLDVRGRVKDKGKSEALKLMKPTFASEIEVKEPEFERLDNKEESLIVKYDFEAKTEDDLIYLNPFMGEGIKENPFKSAERFYPIEMPYRAESIYVATIEVPKGYKVDELPKSVKVNLNEADGSFSYIIKAQDDKVMLRCILVINKANFEAEDYQTLRDFYGYIVKKQSEQIVFKKL